SLATEITRLTGGVLQDKYRDYRLEDYIPGLAETLERWAGECRDMAEYAKKYSGGKRSSVFSALELCEDMLLKLAEEPEDLPRRLGELSEGASSVTRHLAQMVQDMDNNAVGIDRILVHQQDAELPEQKNFFEKLWDGIVRFFLSFSRKEYSVASESKGSLRIWMARPRPYVELLQSMIDSEFTAKTGIRADLSVMPDQGKLALAAASGDAPDVALSVGYVLPTYLDIRGALLDLKQFDDFTEVAQRFPEGLFIPSIYEGGVYAIPETMNFWVMFCRTDIFEQLGIPVPNSMEEVKMLLPELQRRSMNFYFPTAGMIGQKLFPATMPLIVQSGGGFFGSEIGATTLDSEKSLAGFKELTDLFTVYDLPVEVPAPGFYQEFRSGTLPLGIADVSTYNLLLNSAPEIKGLWSVSLFPGLTDESGNIQRYTTGGAESDMIFAQTQMEEEAWEFLKWWSSSEVQARFGMSLQSLHGGTYMWNTANREAFSQLPIPSEHKAVILEQTDWMVEVPWVPGTYMVERELSNAYNSVVVDGIAVRRAMDTAVKRIDREVFRKLEEFGYSNGGRFETPSVSALGQGG
ncbi:MAG: extracellular solute-binding protein, partial [Clostridiales bacterium]|nr:extracellular solute-binding protein [Clostridiales bacterium]